MFCLKTIRISDEVYAKPEKLKRNRSFSELLDYLIHANVSSHLEKLLELSQYKTGREEELAAVVERLRREFKVRSS